MHTLGDTGEINDGNISLAVNGEIKQQGNINQLIWNVAETIANLSILFELKAGDLIFTGTPAGVGAVVKGDEMVAYIDGLSDIRLLVTS